MHPRNFAAPAALVTLCLLFFAAASPSGSAYGQQGNTISGHIFGPGRLPLNDINIELLDSLSRTIARTRTAGSGRYIFERLSSGRFTIRVLPFGTDLERQEAEVEIQNFSIAGVPSGFASEVRDFYLARKKGAPETVGAIFAQEVPESARKLYEQAISDLQTKREQEGLDGLKKALEVFPTYYAALEKLGTEYIRLQHFDAAEILLRIATTVNPRGYPSWYGLGFSLYSQNKNDDAAAAVAKAIELYPTSAEALLLNGVILRRAKKFSEAEAQLLKAAEADKDTNPQIHWQLALLYGNDMKRYKDAARELRTFLKLQPDTKDAEKVKKLIDDFEAKAAKS